MQRSSKMTENDKDGAKPYMIIEKKLFHNASERYRRQKFNHLFSRLEKLLPDAHPQRKMNVPSIVDRMLEYIPKLVTQIQILSKQRDELLHARRSRAWSGGTGNQTIEYIDFSGYLGTQLPIVAVHQGEGNKDGEEITVVNIYVSCSTQFLFSTLLLILQKHSLDLLSASKFVGGDITCFNLQLRKMTVERSLNISLLKHELLILASQRV